MTPNDQRLAAVAASNTFSTRASAAKIAIFFSREAMPPLRQTAPLYAGFHTIRKTVTLSTYK
jgi:hypothetical protein